MFPKKYVTNFLTLIYAKGMSKEEFEGNGAAPQWVKLIDKIHQVIVRPFRVMVESLWNKHC